LDLFVSAVGMYSDLISEGIFNRTEDGLPGRLGVSAASVFFFVATDLAGLVLMPACIPDPPHRGGRRAGVSSA